MPRSLLKRANPFTFPGGQPGFDPNHVANKAHGVKLSVVPNGVNFVNVLNGFPGTPTGTGLLAPIDGVIGPTVQHNPTSSGVTQPLVVPGAVQTTMGIIFTIVGTIANGDSFFQSGSTNNGHQLTYHSTGELTFSGSISGSVNSGLIAAINTPYFFACSSDGSTSISTNFVLLNLRTGKLQTSTVALVAWGHTPVSPCKINPVFFSTDTSNLAALMYAEGPTAKLTMPELIQWAQDPWSFWYPQKFDLLQSVKAPAGGAPSGNLSQAAGIGVAGVIGSSLAPGAIPQASATGSAGSLTPSDASSLTGVAGIGVAGSPTTSLANGGVPPATGIGTVGSLVPNDASSLAGVAGVGVAGSLTPLVAVTLNSATGIGTAGQFTFGAVGRPTQAAGTGVAGTITVSTTASPALGQAAGTGVAGAFNASISVSFSQGVGVGVARGVSPAVSALLAQASGIGTAGGISAQVTGGTVSSTLPAAVGIGVAGVITAFSSTALVATPGGNGGVKNKKRKQVQFAPVERKRVSKPKPAPLQAPALPPQPTRKPGRFENTLVPADPAPPAAPRKLEDLSRFGISAELPSDLNDYAMAERLMAQLEHDERPIRDTIMATIAQIKADIASDLIGA